MMKNKKVTIFGGTGFVGRQIIRELAAAGAGIGFISEAELGEDPRLRRIPLQGADMQMPESLVHLSMRRDLPLIRAFRKAAGVVPDRA